MASSNFVRYLTCNYGDNYPSSLKDCSFLEALQSSCLAPFEFRRPLALYLHNEHDLFSKQICPALINGKFRDVLERAFCVIGWDLMSNNNGALENVVGQWTQLEPSKKWISNKQSALIVLYPTKNDFDIFTTVSGSFNMRDIESVFEEIENMYKNDFKNALQFHSTEQEIKSVGSREFQQIMFDRLGDRDYDSFEQNEDFHLKGKIGYAKFGPPSETGYNKQQQKSIQQTFETIRKCSNNFSEWTDYIVVSFIYNCLEPLNAEKNKRSKKYPDYDPYTDIMPVPLFVIPKCKHSSNPCRIFIDHDNRVYSSLENYKKNNKLHKCVMVLPKSGRYYGNSKDKVVLEKLLSPSCSIEHSILLGTDVTSSVVGITSGAIIAGAAIPAITIAPIALTAASVTGIGVGVYGVVRSALKLKDRSDHKETMSFLNSEARGAYLNIVAGSLGFAGAGATGLVSKLAAKGVNVGQGAKAALNVLNASNVGASAVSIVNSSFEVFDNLKENGKVSTLSIVQLTSSILFFGNAIYNLRSANTIIEEAQVNALKKHQESLQNNRLRKMFNKLVKATMGLNRNVENSRTEVISTLSKMNNSKEVFATLLRSNKLFNREGIRFVAENGKITLNGVVVDISEIGAMSAFKKSQTLLDLPSVPRTASVREINIISNLLEGTVKFNIANAVKYGVMFANTGFIHTVANILQDFIKPIKQKIFDILLHLLDNLNVLNININIFKKNNNDYDVIIWILQLVLRYIKKKAQDYETEYQENKDKMEFPHSLTDITLRGIHWIEKFVELFFNGGCIKQFLLQELIEYVVNKISEKLFFYCNNEEKKEKRVLNKKVEVACDVCKGVYLA